MDKIIMKNLAFFGYHGAMSEENTLGQKFFIDVEMSVALQEAGKSDNVFHTVHYGEAYSVVKAIVEGKSLNLIEAVAEKIAEALLNDFERIDHVKIQLRKPEAPVAGIFDYFAVEIERGKYA